MELDTHRTLERENRELREELRRRAEQNNILEQIVSNVGSLLDSATESMCMVDKEGFFLHMNSSCKRMLGFHDSQALNRASLFEMYSLRDRERVTREFFSKNASKWTGMVNLHNKMSGYETNVMQTIEAISTKHNPTEPTFYKCYFTSPTQESTHEKIRVYNDIISHMPHGVGVWRLERSHSSPSSVLRLACANKLASQYVGVPLMPGSLIHEVLPSGPGGEVHRFLEDVVRTQRVITLDTFRIGPQSFSVTAYPLYPDFVVVIMDPPKNPTPPTPPSPSPASTASLSVSNNKEKDVEWSSFVSSTGLGVAACDGTQVLHANEHLASMLSVPPTYLKGRDLLTVLDTRVRHATRACVEQLRRAMRERVVHHVEVELENHAWRMSVHPMGEGARHTLVVAHRTRTLAPQVHTSQRPMFPILPSSFPSSTASSSSSFNESKSFGDTSVFKDTIDLIPCGIVILRADDDTARAQFRVVSLNRAAQSLPLSKGLTPGHRFDELSSPFEPAFTRALLSATKSHDSRVMTAGEGGKGGEKQSARIVPLQDSAHVAIMLEDTTLFANLPLASKRAISDIVDAMDRGYPILPDRTQHPSKYLRTPTYKQENDMILPFSNKSSALPILPPLHPQHTQSPFSPSPSTPPPSLSITRTEKSEKLERIVQSCVIGIACLDASGSITLANKTFGSMLGYSESELPLSSTSSSLQVNDMIHPEDATRVRNAVRQIANGELPSMDLPVRFVHKLLHNIVWGLASIMSFDKGALMQVQQPTKLKSYPEVLLSDKDILCNTFREMVTGTAVLDVEEHPRIVSANSGFCAIMGASEAELSGHSLANTIHPEDRDAVLAVARDLISVRTQHRAQLLSVRSHPRAGPMRYGALSLSAVLDSKSSPFLLMAQLQLVDKPFS